MQKFVCFICVCTLAYACGNDSSSTSSNERNFGHSADLQALPIKPLTKAEVLVELNSLDAFYATAPEDGGDDDDDFLKGLSETCDALKAQTVSVVDGDLYAHLKVDVGADCGIEGWDHERQTYQIELSFGLRCESSDLSKYNGMAVTEFFEGDDPARGCDKGKNAYRMSVDITQTMRPSESPTNDAILDIKVKAHIHNPQDGYCEGNIEGQKVTTEPCQNTSYRSIYWGPEKERNTDSEQQVFLSILSPQLSFEKNDRYYSSGAFNVRVNDWVGTIENRSKDAAPLVLMNRGEETIREVFGSKRQSFERNSDSRQRLPLAFMR